MPGRTKPTTTATSLGPIWIEVPGAAPRPLPPIAPLHVGSDPRCGVVAWSPGVAPAHIELRPTASGWILTDLGSPSGTWIHGTRISGSVVLNQTAEVALGLPAHGGVVIRLRPQVWTPPSRRTTSAQRAVMLVAAVVLAISALSAAISGPNDDAAADTTTPAPERPEVPEQPVDDRPLVDRLPTTGLEVAPDDRYDGIYDGNEAGEGLPELLDALHVDVERFWAETFRAAELPEPDADLIAVEAGGEIDANCLEAHDDETLIYCPADDRIQLAIPALVHVWHGNWTSNDDDFSDAPAGIGSIALVVAHEWAHAIQLELGLSYDRYGERLLPSVAAELHADCLAGVWANAAYRAGSLGQEELDQAGATLQLLGDYNHDGEGHHGTPDERLAAFNAGLERGVVGDCAPYLERT